MSARKLSEQEIFERLDKRKSPIKRLDKLPPLDKPYQSFLSTYEGMEITPDLIIFGYEEALGENRYLESDYPDISKKLWIIGSTGQGDNWLIDREDGRVLFYDHNQGEYSGMEQFVRLHISFMEFLQMAFLYRDLEEALDEKESLDQAEMENFRKAVNEIHAALFKTYPFNYF